MSDVRLYKMRAGDGAERWIAIRCWEKFKAGMEPEQIAAEELANYVVDKYQEKIAAMLRRVGFQIDPGQQLTPELIIQLVEQRTGLSLDSLTPDGIMTAVDREVTAAMSREVGVPVSTVMNLEVLKQEIIQGALQAVAEGRALPVMPASFVRRLRVAGTWARAGISPQDRALFINRAAQRKYRRSNEQVWQ